MCHSYLFLLAVGSHSQSSIAETDYSLKHDYEKMEWGRVIWAVDVEINWLEEKE